MRAIHAVVKATPDDSARTQEKHEANWLSILAWAWEFPHRMSTIHYVALAVLANSAVSVAAANDVWRLTAFLALGASLGVLWSCLSKEGKEESRMTKARILAGVIGGICVPRLIEAVSPWKLLLADPLIIIATGFLFSIVGFYGMHTWLRLFEKKQNIHGKALMKTVEKAVAAEVEQEQTDVTQRQDSDN